MAPPRGRLLLSRPFEYSCGVQMPLGAARKRRVPTPDGAALNIYDTESDRPPVLLANGLGGPFAAWCRQVEFLSQTHRVISWDYRGLFDGARSSLPSRPTVQTHVDDLALVLDHLGVERASCVGWSMGARVQLEFYAQHPERVSKLVLISASSQRAFAAIRAPGAAAWLPFLLRGARQVPGLMSTLFRGGSRSPATVLWFKRLGIVSARMDAALFQSVSASFAEVHVEHYLDMLLVLGEHEATIYPEQIEVPTLIIAGGKDPLMPEAVARQMAAQISGAQLLILPEGSHYTPLEFPELLSQHILEFLQQGAA